MADLMFPDLAGRFQQGQQLGLNQRLAAQGEQRRNRLAELAGQAYGSTGGQRDSFVQQAIATDPQAGFELGGALQSNEDQRTKSIVNRARLLDSAPDAFRPQLYASMLPELQRMGIGEFPAQYDESVGQTARAIVQAYGAPDQRLAPRVVGDALVDATGKVVYQAPHKNKHEFDSARGVWIPHPDNVAGDTGPERSTMEADIALANDLTAAGFPEAQIEAFLAARGQRASAMPGSQASGPVAIPVAGIGPKQESLVEMERLRLAQEASRRADEAAIRAQRGTAPAGQRFRQDGSLEDIPGAKSGSQSMDQQKAQFAYRAMAEDAYGFAAAFMGIPIEQARQMTPDQIREGIAKGRPSAGPVVGSLPFADRMLNPDLAAYSGAAAGKQARVNNPSGPVTDADFKIAEKSVFAPNKPASVNADLVYTALMRAQGLGKPTGGQSQPSAPGEAVQRARNPQTGEVLELRNGQWVPAR